MWTRVSTVDHALIRTTYKDNVPKNFGGVFIQQQDDGLYTFKFTNSSGTEVTRWMTFPGGHLVSEANKTGG